MIMSNKEKYTGYLIALFVVGLMVNGWVLLFVNAAGAQYDIYFNSSDRFADLIKASLSLKKIVGNPYDVIGFKAWPEIFKSYTVGYNDYVAPGTANTIYHHPPLTFSYFELSAKLLKIGVSPINLILVYVAIYVLVVMFITAICVKYYGFDWKAIILIILMYLIGYPTFFAINRANFPSIICSSIFTAGFLLELIRKKGWLHYILLAVSMNIRPNILIAAMPLIRNPGKYYYRIIVLGFMAIFLFLIFMVIAHNVIYKYDLSSFLDALGVYRKSYEQMSSGDAFNSSLFSMFKFLSVWLRGYDMLYIRVAVGMMCILGGAAIVYYYRDNDIVMSYLFAVVYMFMTPVFADYHLNIFILPVILSMAMYSEKVKYICYIVGTASVLLMMPKFGVYYEGFTYNSIINPGIAIISFISLLFYARNRKKSVKLN